MEYEVLFYNRADVLCGNTFSCRGDAIAFIEELKGMDLTNYEIWAVKTTKTHARLTDGELNDYEAIVAKF